MAGLTTLGKFQITFINCPDKNAELFELVKNL